MNGRALPGEGLDRRRFLVASTSMLAYLTLHSRGIVRTRPASSNRLASLFSVNPSAYVLGLAYLADHPLDRDAASLVREVSGTLPGGLRTLSRASDADLRLAVRQRIADDFAEARTVVVDGWLLSRTEVRLFALAVLG